MFVATLATLGFAAGSAMAATQTVLVGANGTKTFSPSNITAAVGDVINFQFMGGNHTVSQSTFADPCTNSGFTSGFMAGSASDPPTFSMVVNSTTPLWAFCAQTGHCEAGMLMAINAPDTGNTFAKFQTAATGAAATNSTTGTGSTTASAAGSSASASTGGKTGKTGTTGSSTNGTTTAGGKGASNGTTAGTGSTNGTTTGKGTKSGSSSAASGTAAAADASSSSSSGKNAVVAVAGVFGLTAASIAMLL
ncbi:hypothetical protein P7C73_g3831, partial [Tremellales sp. Uapishka_1]